MSSEQGYLTAAVCFAELVAEIAPERYDGAGLGDWSLLTLVGHTSRSLVTVETYLKQPPAASATLADAEAYYEAVHGYTGYLGEVDDRARQAGLALGDDPAATVGDLVMDVARLLQRTPEDFVLDTPFGAVARPEYLRTRTFELVVHGFDVARATGLPFAPPEDVVEDCLTLTTRLAVRRGLGPELLLATTGREPLHPEFTVL